MENLAVAVKRVFKISGMRCTACSGNVEKRLKKIEAVESVEVSFASAECVLVADEKNVPDELVISTVAKLGFQAERLVDDEPPVADNGSESNSERRMLILSAVCTALLLFVSMSHVVTGWLNTALQILFTAVVVFAGRKFFQRGIPALLHGAPDMDTLISCGSGAAVIYSFLLIFRHGNCHLYFDSGAMIITLVTAGKYLESKVRRNTIDAVRSLTALVPETVFLVKEGAVKAVPLSQVTVGDILQVVNGSRIPADGKIIEGSGWVDESMFTGESLAVEKKSGDKVTCGTLSAGGTFKMQVERLGSDTMLANIIKMVRQAQGTKAPIARVADTVSGYFACFVMAVSLITFAAHMIAGAGVDASLNFSLAAMVISCPCALGLATPVALIAGIGRGAKSGILIKSAPALELACKISRAAFDKTGTLTCNTLHFEKMYAAEGFDESVLLANLASAEAGIGHPLAAAAKSEAEKRGISADVEVAELKHFPGRGISCLIGGETWLFGSAKLLSDNAVDISAMTEAGKYSIICIACGKQYAGVAAFGTALRKNALAAVEKLHSMNIECFMLSGDRHEAVSAVAHELKLDGFYAECLPQDKLELVSSLKNGGVLAMVGDGVNDAPSLAKADIGIAIGSGEASAHDAADIVIVGDDVMSVARAIALSRATMRVIKQNLFWAFFYNILAIPMASGLFYALFGGPVLHPAACAGAMAASSLTVVLNAARLKGVKL